MHNEGEIGELQWRRKLFDDGPCGINFQWPIWITYLLNSVKALSSTHFGITVLLMSVQLVCFIFISKHKIRYLSTFSWTTAHCPGFLEIVPNRRSRLYGCIHEIKKKYIRLEMQRPYREA